MRTTATTGIALKAGLLSGVALLAIALAACTDGGPGGGGDGREERVLSANDREFDLDGFSVTAGEAFVVRLNNNDDTEHNFSIYTQIGGEAVFEGDVVQPGDSIEYEIDALDAPEYYFQCDIHPDMNGTISVDDPPTE